MRENLEDILENYAKGRVSLEETLKSIRLINYRAVGEMAKLDIDRDNRIGIPEAILAEGKDKQSLIEIVLAHLDETGSVIVTRVSKDQVKAFKKLELPEGCLLDYNPIARTIVLHKGERELETSMVGILAAGTADIPMAEEAKVVAMYMGCKVISEYDVGVAGIHRLFPCLEKMIGTDAIVVAAGREGTLPAVVAGLVDAPVIGLPVSSGYGLGGNGLAALLSMLQSCSVLTVVNIDAGFVAGAYAAKIALHKANGQKQF